MKAEPPTTRNALPPSCSVWVPPSKDVDLGAEVFRCTLLSGQQTLAAQGQMFSSLIHYVLFPFIMLPYIALMSSIVLVIAMKVLDLHDGEINGPILWILFAACYAFFFWLWHIRPRQDHLCLHEHGIRAQYGMQQVALRFDMIERIVVGREPSFLEKGLRSVMRLFKPRQEAWLDSMDETSLTIFTKDGQRHVMKWLLTRFEPDDVENFFDELYRRYPEYKRPI